MQPSATTPKAAYGTAMMGNTGVKEETDRIARAGASSLAPFSGCRAKGAPVEGCHQYGVIAVNSVWLSTSPQGLRRFRHRTMASRCEQPCGDGLLPHSQAMQGWCELNYEFRLESGTIASTYAPDQDTFSKEARLCGTSR